MWIRAITEDDSYQGAFRYIEDGVHKLYEIDVDHTPIEVIDRFGKKMVANFVGVEEIPGP